MKFRHFLKILPLLVAGSGLAACNETSQPEQTAQVAAPCQCTVGQPVAPAAQAAPAVPTFLHRRHGHVTSSFGYRTSAWSESRTWRESAWSSSSEEYESGGASERECCRHHGDGGIQVSWWTDGYGRRHPIRAWHHRHHRAGFDSGTRHDPWYGYDGNDGLENGY